MLVIFRYARNRGRFSSFSNFRGNYEGGCIDPNSRKATKEVVLEVEDLMAPIEALDYLEVSYSS